MAAPSTFEELARRDEGVLQAAAPRAKGLALGIGPPDQLEGRPRLIVRHAGDLGQGERPGRAGKEEVLSHGVTNEKR